MINLKGNQLILASKSPRRQELLKGLCVDFEVRTKETPEDFPETMSASKVSAFLSEKKAKAFLGELADDEIVLTSDTVVILEGKILGKPENTEEARKMLTDLSAKQHTVSTGITLLSNTKSITLQDEASVFFKPLSDEEIDFYIDYFRPFDKAGAYGIQEWIGYIGVKRLEGSFYTVMGLPVHLVYQALKDW